MNQFATKALALGGLCALFVGAGNAAQAQNYGRHDQNSTQGRHHQDRDSNQHRQSYGHGDQSRPSDQDEAYSRGRHQNTPYQHSGSYQHAGPHSRPIHFSPIGQDNPGRHSGTYKHAGPHSRPMPSSPDDQNRGHDRR